MADDNGFPEGYVSRGGILVPFPSVRRIVDRTAPGRTGEVLRATPEDVMLAAGRMQRDGLTRDRVLHELGVKVGEFGVTAEIADLFLDKARALLAERIAQGLEPAESQIAVIAPDEEDGERD